VRGVEMKQFAVLLLLLPLGGCFPAQKSALARCIQTVESRKPSNYKDGDER
jgi:hypothetical protein